MKRMMMEQRMGRAGRRGYRLTFVLEFTIFTAREV
jgi:hypothetical protein